MAKGWTKKNDPYDRRAFGLMLEEFREETGWSYGDLSRAVGRGLKAKGSLQKAQKKLEPLSYEVRRKTVEVIVREKEARVLSIDVSALINAAGLAGGTRSKVRPFLKEIGEISHTENGNDAEDENPKVQTELPASPQTVKELLREADDLWSKAKGIWTPEILKRVEKALKLVKPGTEEWAKIMVRYPPLMYQQAGDIQKAKKYIEGVEKEYIGIVENPDPNIVGGAKNITGWIQLEQYGNFEVALKLFDESLLLTSDLVVLSDNHHQKIRVVTDIVKTQVEAWLGVRPPEGLVPFDLRAKLEKEFGTNWPAALSYDADDPHHYKVEFDVLALIRPAEAKKVFVDKGHLFRETGNEHEMALGLARAHVSDGDWEKAMGISREAQEGYRRIMYPVGIAHSSEVWAYALMRNGGLGSKQPMYNILDLWLLAALLHAYPTHPLYKIACKYFRTSVKLAWGKHWKWLISYFSELTHRVDEREGIFEALDEVFIKDSYSSMLLFPGLIEGFLGELPEKIFLLEALNK